MKLKKGIALLLAAAAVSSLAGCGNNQNVDGKINVKVGNWPDETNKDALESQTKLKDKFMQENENINIIPDTYKFDTKTFTMKASADQLPTMYTTWFTEITNIMKQGYAADITEQMKKHGFDIGVNPKLLDLVKDSDGKIYGVPIEAYAQGLYIDKKLFKEAGLVNADGSVKVPDTYDELAEFAGIIKEKTGKAGFLFPTTNNCGGWHFLNIAWSYGVEFVKQNADGKYESAFDTQEARDALQYIKDLKWKYNALSDESVIAQEDYMKFFGTYQGGMMFSNPPSSSLSSKYGMDKDDIFVTRMPAGPKGRYSQMGGNLWMFAKNATPEQIDAGLTWLEFTGFSPNVTDDQLENSKISYEQQLSSGYIILDQEAFDVWVNPETLEKTRAVKKEYSNVKHEDYEQYYSFDGVTINPEPAACAQQLYAILDKCIQEVITNKDANVDELIKNASNDYQENHLDKM